MPAAIPLSAIEARVWFDNGYSVSDNATTHSTGLAGDTGNPSGASNLIILTHEGDPAVPAGQCVLEFKRETENYKGIWVVAAALSSALPAEGPYAAERAAHPDCVIEQGTCTVVKGDKAVTVVRPSSPAADADIVGRVFLIYTTDSDIDGNVVAAPGATTMMLTSPFMKTGSFNYAIVKRWWDRTGLTDDPPTNDSGNLVYAQFSPALCTGDIEQPIWRTPPMAAPEGEFFATLYCRNSFGVGTKLTAGSSDTPAVLTDTDCVTVTVTGGAAEIDLSAGRSFHIATGGDDISISAINGKCGRAYLVLITGAGAITLAADMNARGATLTRSTGGRDYLGIVYNATDAEYDCWWSMDA
mgnify:CR=1 FL=1